MIPQQTSIKELEREGKLSGLLYRIRDLELNYLNRRKSRNIIENDSVKDYNSLI